MSGTRVLSESPPLTLSTKQYNVTEIPKPTDQAIMSNTVRTSTTANARH